MAAADKGSIDRILDEAERLEALFAMSRSRLAACDEIGFQKRFDRRMDDWIMMGWTARYAREIVGPRIHDYAGKTDTQFWGPDIAREFRKSDEMAKRLGSIRVAERYTNLLDNREYVYVAPKFVYEFGGQIILESIGFSVLAERWTEEREVEWLGQTGSRAPRPPNS